MRVSLISWFIRIFAAVALLISPKFSQQAILLISSEYLPHLNRKVLKLRNSKPPSADQAKQQIKNMKGQTLISSFQVESLDRASFENNYWRRF